MGDVMKKVLPGDRLKIPAKTFNTFIDAARDFQARQHSRTSGPKAPPQQNGIVLVRNDTGADRHLFEILGIDGPLYGPDDNLEEFEFRFALKGITPDADHLGNFVILLEPVKDGQLGRAMIQGITPVKVQVETEGYQYADVCTDEGSEYAHLVSAPRGAAFILYIETGTGEKWAIVRVANVTPSRQDAAIHGLKVAGLWKAWGVPWTNFETDGYIAFVSGKFAFLDKSWVDEEGDDLNIKATGPRGTNAPIGYRGIAVDDFLGWVAGDGFEEIPGSDECYDGEVVPFVGPEAALPDWQIIAGKGLVLENPVPYDRKLHVELADDVPGLMFDVDTDDGKLQVDPDEQKAIAVSADGVGVKLADPPGLEFDAGGGLKALPDTTRGMDVDANGLFIVVNTNQGIDVDAQGVKALADATRAVSITQDGIGVDVDPNYALQVSDNKVQVVVKTAGGIELTDGALDIPEHADGGLNHREDGRLGVKADTARGLDTDENGAFVEVEGTPAAPVTVIGQGWVGFDASGVVAHGKPNPRAETTPYLRITFGNVTSGGHTVPAYWWQYRGQEPQGPFGEINVYVDENGHTYEVNYPA